MTINRRTVLVSGLAGVGVLGAGLLGVLEGVLPGETVLRRAMGMVGEDGAVPAVAGVPVQVRRMASAARGTDVDVVTMVPTGVEPGLLPVCVVLHGRGSGAQGMVDLGLPSFLAAAIGAGVAPFALVAVDGGDSYWVARDRADDPQAMLRDELPGWLRSSGLTAPPAAALGISMGGFGALVYARDRGTSAPTVAVLSPALFATWDDAAGRDGFADETSWAANEPLRHTDALPAGLALGIWCGREDPFVGAATELADRTRAAVAHFDHGEHTPGYWRRVLPDALRFVGASTHT